MRLTWTEENGTWRTRTVDGSEGRIRPDPERPGVFVFEVDLGDKTYAKGADARQILDRACDLTAAEQAIYRCLKESVEGHLLRYETTGIQDPPAAIEAIHQMDLVEWSRRRGAWQIKNCGQRAAGAERDATPSFRAERDVCLRFQIDTNRINARGRLCYMNQLERWNGDGVIEILLAEPAAEEASRGSKAAARVAKVRSYPQTMTTDLNDDETTWRARIERLVFPGGPESDSERNDVEIIFHAWKYGAILVTADGASKTQPDGILGAKANLAEIDVKVMTDEEACAYVREQIRERDVAVCRRPR